jgi:hypothetical protein
VAVSRSAGLDRLPTDIYWAHGCAVGLEQFMCSWSSGSGCCYIRCRCVLKNYGHIQHPPMFTGSTRNILSCLAAATVIVLDALCFCCCCCMLLLFQCYVQQICGCCSCCCLPKNPTSLTPGVSSGAAGMPPSVGRSSAGIDTTGTPHGMPTEMCVPTGTP